MLYIESKLNRFLLLSGVSLLITTGPSMAAEFGLTPDLIADTSLPAAHDPTAHAPTAVSDVELRGALDSLAAVELRGTASVNVNPTHDKIARKIDTLVAVALQRDEKMQELNKRWFHYKSPKLKVAAQCANAL